VEAAIVGGTGIGGLLVEGGGEPVACDTPFGEMRGVRRPDGLIVVQRHGAGHKLPPHLVPYRTIAAGLAELGVKVCLSSAAVGSLVEALRPGQLAAVRDFIDFSGRNITMFEDSVSHADFTPGVSPRITRQLMDAGADQEAVYACTNGPRYETPAEVRALRHLGADIVGMTMATEAVVMREVSIEYGCLAIVTNFAAGILDQPLDHAEVESVVASTSKRALEILLQVASAN
jgi:5'-methylthioadenosine phosphorylase